MGIVHIGIRIYSYLKINSLLDTRVINNVLHGQVNISPITMFCIKSAIISNQSNLPRMASNFHGQCYYLPRGQQVGVASFRVGIKNKN